MNLEALFGTHTTADVRYALSGAAGGFGRTLLAQTRCTERISPQMLLDRDMSAMQRVCAELGLGGAEFSACRTPDEVRAAVARDRVALVDDPSLLGAGDWNILVEATGNPAAGYALARGAIADGRHVAMVSKEVDSVAGVTLARQARERGVVYSLVEGDQPANLVGLVAWARTVGLDIVAIGKSTEYDLDHDPSTGMATQFDQQVHAPGLASLLTLGQDVRGTLGARAKEVSQLASSPAADYCELGVVANATGMTPDGERLHYPIARIDELADIYAEWSGGGVTAKPPIVDVFTALRLPGEASFAGGVFAVVRTHDPVTWRAIGGEGHVVSRDGRCACVYLPYHLMGVETPITLLSAVLLGLSTGSPLPTQQVVLGGRAEEDIEPGTVLSMCGHHHDVRGIRPVPVTGEQMRDAAPLYLAASARTRRYLHAGDLLRLSDVEGMDADLLAAHLSGVEA